MKIKIITWKLIDIKTKPKRYEKNNRNENKNWKTLTIMLQTWKIKKLLDMKINRHEIKINRHENKVNSHENKHNRHINRNVDRQEIKS